MTALEEGCQRWRAGRIEEAITLFERSRTLREAPEPYLDLSLAALRAR